MFIKISIKSRSFDLSNLIAVFYLSYFKLQQNILSKLFELVNCKHFIFSETESSYNLANFVGIQCYSTEFYFYIFFLILPSLILYALIVPLSTILFSWLNRNDFKNKATIIKFDFLMRQPFYKYPSIWYCCKINLLTIYLGEMLITLEPSYSYSYRFSSMEL